MDTIYAYIAAIIDGEGHFFIEKQRNALVLGVANTSLDLLTWLHEQAGGSIQVERDVCPADCDIPRGEGGHICKRKATYRWHLFGERAAIVLRCVHPYMIIKKQRATECLAIWEASPNQMERPLRRISDMRKNRLEMVSFIAQTEMPPI